MTGMNFVWASLVILAIAFVLGLALALAAHGYGVWLLILAIIGFLALFIRYGCQTH